MKGVPGLYLKCVLGRLFSPAIFVRFAYFSLFLSLFSSLFYSLPFSTAWFEVPALLNPRVSTTLRVPPYLSAWSILNHFHILSSHTIVQPHCQAEFVREKDLSSFVCPRAARQLKTSIAKQISFAVHDDQTASSNNDDDTFFRFSKMIFCLFFFIWCLFRNIIKLWWLLPWVPYSEACSVICPNIGYERFRKEVTGNAVFCHALQEWL